MTVARLTAPPLEWRAPDCPSCLEEVDHDGDSLYCDRCGLNWAGGYSDPGEATEMGRAQCPAAVAPFTDLAAHHAIRGRWYRCILDEGHTDDPGGTAEHFGLRSDLDPWEPNVYEDYRWDSSRRYVVPVPAQGPTLPPERHGNANGPVVALPPRRVVDAAPAGGVL